MKQYLNLLRGNGQQFALSLISGSIIVLALLATGCTKSNDMDEVTNKQEAVEQLSTEESNAVFSYTGLPTQTIWELQQARAATARYRTFQNAINDEYIDINVIVPEMGFHYLKLANLDTAFDFRKPEILVYNREEDGSMELVAVEYAVPLNVSTNAPAGFTGNQDVWDHNDFFGLWLLHAWVWRYNPDGVFNPTNPEVHLH